MAVSFQDNSPLPPRRLSASRLEVRATIGMRNGQQRNIEFRDVKMASEYRGVWELDVDLKSELGLEENKQSREILNDIHSMKVQIFFHDSQGQTSRAEAFLTTHYSPYNRQIKVTSSTKHARVGEYFVLHVQSNYYMEQFHYVIMSKGMILLTGQENMQVSVRTFAIPLSAEMAPAATVLVYHVGHYGQVTADSLTFPVNGISRNNVS